MLNHSFVCFAIIESTLGVLVQKKECNTVYLIMPEKQNSAAKRFTVDFPQGEEHRKIIPHINKGEAK